MLAGIDICVLGGAEPAAIELVGKLAAAGASVRLDREGRGEGLLVVPTAAGSPALLEQLTSLRERTPKRPIVVVAALGVHEALRLIRECRVELVLPDEPPSVLVTTCSRIGAPAPAEPAPFAATDRNMPSIKEYRAPRVEPSPEPRAADAAPPFSRLPPRTPGAGTGSDGISKVASPSSAAPRSPVEQATRIGAIPPMTPAFAELQCLYNRGDATPADIVRVVSVEPTLAIQLIRSSNAAYYRSCKVVTNLRDAIVRMGMQQVIAVLMEAAVNERLKAPSPEAQRVLAPIWKASTYTAQLTRLMAQGSDFARPDDAYLAGLFHNVGEVVIAWRAFQTGEHATLDELGPRIERSHELVGAEAARIWALPPLAQSVAGYHHRPRPGESARDRQLREAVVAAWGLARLVVGDYLPGLHPVDGEAALSALDLPPATMRRVMEEVEQARTE